MNNRKSTFQNRGGSSSSSFHYLGHIFFIVLGVVWIIAVIKVLNMDNHHHSFPNSSFSLITNNNKVTKEFHKKELPLERKIIITEEYKMPQMIDKKPPPKLPSSNKPKPKAQIQKPLSPAQQDVPHLVPPQNWPPVLASGKIPVEVREFDTWERFIVLIVRVLFIICLGRK